MESEHRIAEVVRAGLTSRPKRLPPFLLYDARGSALFEKITALPEYYLSRTELELLRVRADEIAASVARGPVTVLELGAGTATKTEVLLRALVRRQRATRFIPADISPSPLAEAKARLTRSVPGLEVSPFVGTHEAALSYAERVEGPLLVAFIGSSIGNYDPPEATGLLSRVRRAIGRRGTLLLGIDLRKPVEVLIPAYDDAAGVTAAFDRNVLERINRELGGHFDPSSFRHVALWNEAASAIEMHLESTRAQRVRIDALELEVALDEGERIHTESSHKYDAKSIARLLRSAGLASVLELRDAQSRYALQLAVDERGAVEANDLRERSLAR